MVTSKQLDPIREYAFLHICQDHNYWSRLLTAQILTESLRLLSLARYPEVLPLDVDPEPDPLPRFLASTARFARVDDQRRPKDVELPLRASQEAVSWIRQVRLEVSGSAGREWSREKLRTGGDAPYEPSIELVDDPLLTRRALRESPHFIASTGGGRGEVKRDGPIFQLVPTSTAGLVAGTQEKLCPQVLTLTEEETIAGQREPKLEMEVVLDLRPRLTSTQLKEISTLYSALPPSVLAAGARLSKKKKKPSFIMLEAERRERTTELLQAPAWREEAELVWGELRDALDGGSGGLSSPPIFPSRLESIYFTARDSRPPPPSIITFPGASAQIKPRSVEEIADSLRALGACPQVRIQGDSEDDQLEIDQLEEDDPFNMGVIDRFQNAPPVWSSDVGTSSACSGECNEMETDWDVVPYLLQSNPSSNEEDWNLNGSVDGPPELEVPLLPRKSTFGAGHANANDALLSSASDALSRVLPALTSQQNLDELHLDTDGTNALDAFSASGRRSPDSLLGVQSTHLADDSALTLSRVDDDVSRTLLFLTGSETLEAAETWLEKDILTDPDDESLPTPRLPDPCTYFPRSALNVPRLASDLVLSSERSTVVALWPRLQSLVGVQPLTLEMTWKPFLGIPETSDGFFPDTDPSSTSEPPQTVKDADGLFISPGHTLESPPSSLPVNVQSSRLKLGYFCESMSESSETIYTRREQLVRCRGGKRARDETSDDVESGAVSPSRQKLFLDTVGNSSGENPLELAEDLLMEDDHFISPSSYPLPSITLPLSPNGARRSVSSEPSLPCLHGTLGAFTPPARLTISPAPSPPNLMLGRPDPALLSANTSLAHFISTRSSARSLVQRQWSPRPRPASAPRQQQLAPYTTRPASPDAHPPSQKLPVNLLEIEQALASCPGENSVKETFHVLGGDKILQNRAIYHALRQCSIVTYHSSHFLFSMPSSSRILDDRPSSAFGLDLLLGPTTGLYLTPLQTLPSLQSEVLSLVSLLQDRLDTVYIVLTFQPREGVDPWTPPVRNAVSKLRRVLAIRAWNGRSLLGDEEGGGFTVKVGWASVQQMGLVVRDLAELNGANESDMGAALTFAEDDELESFTALADLPSMNPLASILVLTQTTLEEFLELDEVSRMDTFSGVLGAARVTRINEFLRSQQTQLDPSSSSWSSGPLPPSPTPSMSMLFGRFARLDTAVDEEMMSGRIDLRWEADEEDGFDVYD